MYLSKFRRTKMASKNVYDDSKAIRLVLIGKTGEGKSSVGNTILGTKAFVSNISAQSVTQKTIRRDVTRGSKKIRVVDTPGLFDTGDLVEKNQEWLTDEILKSTSLSFPGPNAFLFVIQIGRLTTEDAATAKKMFDLFGETIYKYIIIVFTHGQKLQDDDTDFKKYLESMTMFFSDLRSKCGNRVLCVDNKRSSEQEKQEFIDELLRLVYQIKTRSGYYKNKSTEEATRLVLWKIDEIQETNNVSYEETVQKLLNDIEEEGTFFKYLKSGSFGLAIAVVVAGLIAFFTPATVPITVGVAAASGTASAVAMVKDKCSIM